MNAFENYLLNLDKKNKIMVYLSVVFVALMLLNQLVPPLMSEQEELQNSISSMQLEIVKNASKRLKRDLASVQKQVLEAQTQLDEKKDRTNFLLSGLYKVKFAFFREQELARSLDLLLDESIAQNIDLGFIKNSDAKIANLSNLIAYKKSMRIDGVGSFAHILRFINFVENLDLLFEIKDIKLEQTKDAERVHFSLDLNFYGVGL